MGAARVIYVGIPCDHCAWARHDYLIIVQVSWTQLGSVPVVVEMDQLYILVRPNDAARAPTPKTPDMQVGVVLYGFFACVFSCFLHVFFLIFCKCFCMDVFRMSHSVQCCYSVVHGHSLLLIRVCV